MSQKAKSRIARSASMIITELLKVKPNERILLIADTKTDTRMTRALAEQASKAGADHLIILMPSREDIYAASHTMLPAPIRKIMSDFDIVVGLNATSGAPSYDSRLAELLHSKKIRYMSMVLRSIENWTEGAATADYQKVYETAQRLAEAFKGREIKVTTRAGTDLTAIIEGRKAIIEAGIASKAGQSAAFSDGEVSLSTVEGTAEGTAVIDGPIFYLGQPKQKVTLEIHNGKATGISGGAEADTLKEWLTNVKNFDNFAEIGVGVNPRARRNGDWQEEKKRLGTTHFALGDNIYYFGKIFCPLHVDMVQYKPTISIDGESIMRDGRLTISSSS